jgi:hypothetical protein
MRLYEAAAQVAPFADSFSMLECEREWRFGRRMVQKGEVGAALGGAVLG